MDDNKVVRGRCPWTTSLSSMDSCPWTMIKNSWMIEPSIQWTDERATLWKIQHVGAVNKPMIIALDSLSS